MAFDLLMTAGMLVIFALILAGSLTAVPALVLAVAADIALPGVAVDANRLFLLAAAASAIPGAAWLCGELLDAFAFDKVQASVFAPAALLLAGALLLADNSLFRLLEACAASPHLPAAVLAQRVLEVCGGVVYAAGLSAFVVISVPLCFEIPMQWVLKGRSSLEVAAVRPLIVLAVVAISFHFFTGFFGRLLDWHLLN